jgi:hypothetical protein
MSFLNLEPYPTRCGLPNHIRYPYFNQVGTLFCFMFRSQTPTPTRKSVILNNLGDNKGRDLNRITNP